VLNVLGSLVDLEPAQAELLEKVCSGPLISAEELRLSGAFEHSVESKPALSKQAAPGLFDGWDG
jgi:hypothetical protein